MTTSDLAARCAMRFAGAEQPSDDGAEELSRRRRERPCRARVADLSAKMI
jgi:hypothetical protein